MSRNSESRPSNAQLVWIGLLQFFFAGVVGVLFLPLIYVLFTGQRETAITSLISAGVAMLAYIPLYFKYGIEKRKKFIDDGGDPHGMNLWMFGAMRFDWMMNREESV